MNGNPDPKAGSPPPSGNAEPERAIDPVLMNALADVVTGGGALADEESRAVVRDVLEAVTSTEERDRFHDAIETVYAEGEASGEVREAVSDVVDSVREALADRNARVVVDHETPIPVDERDAALYDFATNEDPSALSRLDLPSQVGEYVSAGAEHVADGEYEAAAEAFDRAVDAAGTGDASVTTRTLAAWANHWAGDDRAAIDYVEEALHLHADAWPPTLAGYSAEPDPSFARPEQFRDGKYAAMATLRYTVDCPEGTAIEPFVDVGEGDDPEWVELSGTDECTPIPRLGSDPTLRLRLSGEVPAFPGMHGYYVGLGIVDLEVTEFREVYRLLVDGPLGESVVERIRVEVAE